MDVKLEEVVIPVADVYRSKTDIAFDNGFGSCSSRRPAQVLGMKITPAAPGSAQVCP